MKPRNLLILLIFFALSCTPRHKRTQYGECTTNDDCPRGKVCIANLCEHPPEEIRGADVTPPAGMVYVPAGSFVAGVPRGAGSFLEQPQGTYATRAFFIDRSEVTVREYLQCVAAKKCNDYKELHHLDPSEPVVWITWQDARAYCEYAKKRLPTELEWEKACRGTDGRLRPWGDAGAGCANTWMRGCPRPARCAPSPYGACDMVGGVWEWTATGRPKWDPQKDRKRNGLRYGAPEGDDLRVIKGGSREDGPEVMRCSARLLVPPSLRSSSVGFRCARDVRNTRQ